jgi:DNA polymerase V
VDTQARQADLFGLSPISNKIEVMGVIDAINARMGRGTIRLASEGITKNWLMRRGNKSQNYTTDWDELICVTK